MVLRFFHSTCKPFLILIRSYESEILEKEKTRIILLVILIENIVNFLDNTNVNDGFFP